MSKCGVSRKALRGLHAELAYSIPRFGEEGVARCVVRWHYPPEDLEMAGSGIEAGGAFAAEFDLQTGELKYITVYRPQAIGWMGMPVTER